MGSAFGQVLPLAIGVAISPVPIIALILMLFSKSATKNSLAFALGWILGLTVVGVVVLVLGLESDSGGESDTIAAVKVVIGLLLIGLAGKQWTSRPEPGEEPTLPGWMAAIDSFSPGKSLGVAFLLSSVNPKNLGLTLAAATTIGSAGLDTTEEFITLGFYVLIASITIIVPVAIYLILGDRSDKPLTEAKEWLLANNNTVMFVLFLVLGFKVLGDGLSVLL